MRDWLFLPALAVFVSSSYGGASASTASQTAPRPARQDESRSTDLPDGVGAGPRSYGPRRIPGSQHSDLPQREGRRGPTRQDPASRHPASRPRGEALVPSSRARGGGDHLPSGPPSSLLEQDGSTTEAAEWWFKRKKVIGDEELEWFVSGRRIGGML